jgi:uncharacterized protein
LAVLLDDVMILAKVAGKKTAGVLGDDLALNAEQLVGLRAEREIPVVLAVAKGSAVNKMILVPAALAISALAHWAVSPLLMVGGAYLCFEGVEKVAHSLFPPLTKTAQSGAVPAVNFVEFERKKIKGAVRTDFILSGEIVVISLGTVADRTLGIQALVLTMIAAVMTVGVYGFVIAIIKLDDVGLYLSKHPSVWAQRIGVGLLHFAPYLMKGLSFTGTVAMFLVGGGILSHGIPGCDGLVSRFASLAFATPVVGPFLRLAIPSAFNAVTGILAGTLAHLFFSAIQRIRVRLAPSPH